MSGRRSSLWTYVAWNTDKCKVGVFHLPRERVWTPDLEVYTHTAATPDRVNQPMVSIDGSGMVYYTTSKRLSFFCDLPDTLVDGDYNCTFPLGSWALGNSEIVLKVADEAGGLSPKYYVGPAPQSGQPWELVSSTSTVYNAAFDCCPEPFSVIDYTITWRFHANLNTES